MPKLLLYITLLSALLAACETDPDIFIDSEPQPVIFGIINRSETVHYLKIGRTFGAKSEPRESVGIWDSLYFREVHAEIEIYDIHRRNRTLIIPERVTEVPKDSGLFLAPGQELYRFEYAFRWAFKNAPPYEVTVRVGVPELPMALVKINVVNLDYLNTPTHVQQFFLLEPASPIRIQWDGNPWNEIDVSFEIEEKLPDRKRSRWIHIQNTNYSISPHDKYREMTITYDEFLRELAQHIPLDPEVKTRRFGNINIEISGGDENMVNYIRYYGGYTDFNLNGYSNIENGIGLLASRCHFRKDSLHFDYETIQSFLADSRLRYLKLDPYQEK